MKKAPKGSLIVSSSNGCTQYLCKDGKKKEYIPANKHELAKMLAQKDYDRLFLNTALNEKNHIEKILKNLPNTELTDIYSNLISQRRELVTPYILTDEEFLKQWQSVKYKGKKIDDNVPVIITERGERVRSKSEKIIADKLLKMGIPYRYEYPLNLKGYGVVYPDFTLLNMHTRKEVYVEHFGKMDDADYCLKAINKIHLYEKNGIYIGKKFIVTFETSKQTLNMSVVENMLRDALML